MANPTRSIDSVAYVVDDGFTHWCGFDLTSAAVLEAIDRTNTGLAALPPSLFRIMDLKAQSGMVSAFFVSELADAAGAAVNPIEKGHPDIVPLSAVNATEAELRNYPVGLEVKSTVGMVTQGVKLKPGQARVEHIENIVWQAHHREVRSLMGVTWDYVAGTDAVLAAPTVTGVFFGDDLVEGDWGNLSGQGGRSTNVSGLRKSGREKMASGAIAVLNQPAYLDMLSRRVGELPLIAMATNR